MTGAKKPSPAAWRRYLRFWGSNITEDVDAEIAFHVQMRLDEYVARGMTESEARRVVLDRLGDVDAAKAESIRILGAGARDARNAGILEALRGDVRLALRSLFRSPGWTAVVLVTIALGVGATTTAFSVADSLLLRPLSYPNASRVVVIRREISLASRMVWGPMRLEAVQAWRTNARALTHLQPFSRSNLQLGTGTDASPVEVGVIDTGFFAFAGAHPILGRAFSEADVHADAQRVVMLAEGVWRSRFGAANDVIGKTLRLNDSAYTIVGVAPSSLKLPDLDLAVPQIWLPLVRGPLARTANVAALLAPNVSTGAAAAELQSILDRTGADPVTGLSTTMRVLHPTDTLGVRRAILMLSGAVALLLLVACINLAHLLLARGVSRERELAVRYALGAGRSRLVALLVTESVVIAAAGGALAIFVAWAGLRLLAAVHPATMFAFAHVTAGGSLVVVAGGVACVAGIAIGLLAALRTARNGVAQSLRGGACFAQMRGRRLRSALVVGEVGLSAVLLIGALLLVHAVIDLQRKRLGFDVSSLYAVSFSARTARLSQPSERAAFADELRDRAAHLAGASDVTLAYAPPTNVARMLAPLESEEHPAPPDATPIATPMFVVAADYFGALKLSFVAGHTFNAQSAANDEIVIGETLARSLWPDGNAVGHRLLQPAGNPNSKNKQWWTVIGVVSDVVVHSLLDADPEPAIYRPIDRDWGKGSITLLVRLRSGDATAALKQLAVSMRPGAAIPTITNLEQQIEQTAAAPRFTMIVLVTFAALAVVLAATGLYGVIAYTVAQRTREIGVRIALGATRTAIARLVVGNGLRLAVAGVVLGLAGAAAATRIIEHLLYGVSRFDPLSFSVGALLLLVVSAIACLVPMLRATSVDPIVAVRVE